MICSNIIEEHTKQRPCWFPKDPSSPFDLCKRCTFYRVENILRAVAKGDLREVSSMESNTFQSLIEEKHFDSLSAALIRLRRVKYPSLSSLYTSLYSDSYHQYLLAQVYHHTQSNRCHLYQLCLSKHQKNPQIVFLPWNCWHCMAWVLRQKKSVGLYEAFAKGVLSSNTVKSIKSANPSDFIDCLVSLELKGKGHAARLLFDQYRRIIQNEEKAKEMLELFHFQPAMIHTLFKPSYTEYFPTAWKEPNYKTILQKRALQFVRKRNWVFKEELTMRTWAPHRLFPWCFDIQELADFPE